jgi:hypothetical protein
MRGGHRGHLDSFSVVELGDVSNVHTFVLFPFFDPAFKMKKKKKLEIACRLPSCLMGFSKDKLLVLLLKSPSLFTFPCDLLLYFKNT